MRDHPATLHAMSGVSMLPILAEGAEATEKSFPLSPVGFGALALGILLLALYVLTRINPDR
ncbi:MAG TPA: hypothetical protein DHW34_03850 [Actinobacteria bacterium]|nr:hypothetical protein [Actinomycetota bacterium]